VGEVPGFRLNLCNTNNGEMKKLYLGLLFLFVQQAASSQKVFFIYIQSESGQPFYVKLSEKTHNSSASGYIILPKLIDSVYNFSIGFPQQSGSPQNYTVTIGKRDQGFLLKKFGEKGWGLFHLQTMSVIMAGSEKTPASDASKKDDKDVSPFTEVLSKASDDPSLKEKTIQVIPEEKKKDEIPGATTVKEVVIETKPQPESKPVEIVEKKADSKEVITAENKEPVLVKIDPPVEVPVVDYKMSVVAKKSESSTTEGFGLVYTDTYNGQQDTIRLIIPNPKPLSAIFKTEIKEEAKEKTEVPVEPIVSANKNVNCPAVATESDFFQLRKIMAAAESDDDMIIEAKKYCKKVCFSVAQVGNLSSLFLTDEGKYKFFDATYRHSSDAENFPSLQSQLKEEYYINRFKAMLRN
jgi:Domain of unknown function (DUF4476)